jgi:2-polyprenyl-3-methyl-5-hydroxy-6-metoxy-1,4-benzoquinol methylase
VSVVAGRFSNRDYHLLRCNACEFVFIGDPWTDFAAIYNDLYYAGRGADPLVDYRFELAHPERTIRGYEWMGIAACVSTLLGGLQGRRWLDFGCGNGGLVRYLNAHTAADAVGFEEGAVVSMAREENIPIVGRDRLSEWEGRFDVVTAIEVIEHTLDPVSELRAMRRLLRAGGLLFLTTGNAAPFSERLDRWSYVVPEIHISLFTPDALAYAMRAAGLEPDHVDVRPGFDQVLKFKVLKNLRIRRRNRLIDALPARALASVAERRVRLADHPIAWAR